MLSYYKSYLLVLILIILSSLPGIGQVMESVPKAFALLGAKPAVFQLDNPIAVPTEKGHLQGVQLVQINGSDRLLISGSSKHTAYVLQANLQTSRTETLIPLMQDPFRHAGGIQVSYPYLVVGIEDNIQKTISKVVLYRLNRKPQDHLEPVITIEREGTAKRFTAGATGLIPMGDKYLVVVGNWDSRNWDFYLVDPEQSTSESVGTFEAPSDWASYQSINLVKDHEAIYAIGLYGKGGIGRADLIQISQVEAFRPTMSRMMSKDFKCVDGVDFNTAAGIQVDQAGHLHIWATQRDARKQITVSRYSP